MNPNEPENKIESHNQSHRDATNSIKNTRPFRKSILEAKLTNTSNKNLVNKSISNTNKQLHSTDKLAISPKKE